jgi:hypothetical protein
MAALGGFFQQRHLLAHREGIVDEEYVAKGMMQKSVGVFKDEETVEPGHHEREPESPFLRDAGRDACLA